MIFKDTISNYVSRGSLLRNEDIYTCHGSIPVFSAQTSGPFGYVNKSNYHTSDRTYIVSLNGGNAGYVIIPPANSDIWFTSDACVFEMTEKYESYDREIVAIWIQEFFVKNRTNNGTQPKFSFLSILNKDIDEAILDQLVKVSTKKIQDVNKLADHIKGVGEQINATSGKKIVTLRNFISGYRERGTRLVKGRDLYVNHGEVKVISATTSGPMGYYNNYNERVDGNKFLYTIDGAKAGSILILEEQNIFFTDHAGIITVDKDKVDKYGRVAIALWMQDYFLKNRTRNGSQPTFILKNILDIEMDLDKLEILSSYNLDDFLYE